MTWERFSGTAWQAGADAGHWENVSGSASMQTVRRPWVSSWSEASRLWWDSRSWAPESERV